MTDDDLMVPGRDLQFGSGIVGVCDICGKRQAVVILEKERFKLCVLDFLNKTWIGSKATPGRPLPPYRSERVWFETSASSSGQAQGVLLVPTKPVRHPAVLVTPDVYGLTTMNLDAGIRFAHEGYEVFLPDLGKLDGLSPREHLALRADVLFRGGVHLASPRVHKLVALYLDALAFLRARPMVDPQKVAVFGASYGGSLAVGVAGEDRGLSALVLAFPMPVVPTEYTRLINAPVLLLAGEKDPRAARARIQLDGGPAPTSGAPVVRIYPGARHLFLAREDSAYDLPTAEAAWSEALSFLKEKLLPPPPKPPAPKTAPPPAAPPPAAGTGTAVASVPPTPPVAAPPPVPARVPTPSAPPPSPSPGA